MKGRIKFFNYFIACIATLSLATFAACSDDDPETPSGKLVLTASASSFVAGEGNVTFMVTYDGEDVTSQAAITNVTPVNRWKTLRGPRQRSASTSSRLFTTAILRIPLR
ncbi:hypothetical protein [Alistipes putredinis]|uniref:hypothetical protein n=1 Tax=Alistipes putredinis TaxID=28117 RepID=UPI002FDDC2DA